MHQSEAVRFAEGMFGSQDTFDVQRLIPVFRNTTIQCRHFCVPTDWFLDVHSFSEKNREYILGGVDLA
jgi:alkylresorcinol/alkylpyrone synthase